MTNEIPKLAFPLRFTSAGRAVTVEQDSAEEINGCVETLVRTTRGQRLERPDFGIRDMVLEQVRGGQAAQHVQRQIITHEPRALAYVDEDLSALADMMLGVRAKLEEASNG